MPETIIDPVLSASCFATTSLCRALEAVGLSPVGIFEIDAHRYTVKLLVGPDEEPDVVQLRVVVESINEGQTGRVRIKWQSRDGSEVVRCGALSEVENFADWAGIAERILEEMKR